MADLQKQAAKIAETLKKAGFDLDPNDSKNGLKLENTEIVALIAYLQKLGKDINANSETAQLK